MHDARPQDTSHSRQITTMVKQRVDQRTSRVTRRRVNDQTRRFVHHDQIRILVQNRQGDCLRYQGRGQRLRWHRLQGRARPDALTRATILLIQPDPSLLDPTTSSRAREPGELCQGRVDSPTGFLFGYHEHQPGRPGRLSLRAHLRD